MKRSFVGVAALALLAGMLSSVSAHNIQESRAFPNAVVSGMESTDSTVITPPTSSDGEISGTEDLDNAGIDPIPEPIKATPILF